MGPKEYDCSDMPGGEGQLADFAKQVDEIHSAMDQKFVKWDVYRSAGREWVLTAEMPTGQTFHETNSQYVMVLVKALCWVPLPLVPRPPQKLCRNGFVIAKLGPKWRAAYDGRDCGVSCGTKREVEQFADRAVARSNLDSDIWDATHGWTIGKTEGVDFRWMR